ncbi:nucleoside/nucleotide kinase family protein [Frigoribacterium sp. CG_9.8]|uniref:nucleoside/nucleotide kinase family protein n=1 Tax=Frigoribacterium sp. CG_9.8 TaxID=2787733 RepID=UPI0018CBD97A|nr:nucleoside/nucleotide kinase family protein [Frigoribacterium sp. CG_9.8]MBG6107986.1 pantothenate kinase [Frigoribacterium sp. CG_9.8]
MGATPVDLTNLADHLRARLHSTGSRQIVGIAGAPGTGKSTFALGLAEALGRQSSAIVPMDGFHLANEIIEGTLLRDRKGAIDTFDIGGYLSLLRRLRDRDEPVVFAPCYRRGLEEPIAASIAVAREIDFVITEGNYLLSLEPSWRSIRCLVDEIWFLDTASELRIPRLVERHVAFGMSRDAAIAWATGPDEANARVAESTRQRADRQISGG